MNQSENVTYQVMPNPADKIDKLIKDDSPQAIKDSFWEFMGIDIQTAKVKPHDFQNVLKMVDLWFIYKLREFPQSEWEGIKIVERYIRQSDGQEIINVYDFVTLWKSMRAKIYFKLMGARDGFKFQQLTESRSRNVSIIEERPAQQPEKKKRWGLI